MMRKHLALFSGLGGFIVAANRAGFETVYANDVESSCVETLRNSFDGLPVSQTDISKISVENELGDVGPIDLLSGGFPCQSFSNAGSNLGFDDPRGQLFFEIVRICKELKEPPKVLLLENVSFLKIFDNGSRLSTVLHHLRLAGYWVSVNNALIINSKELCGVPQSRERLFIIAYHSKYFKKNYFDSALKKVKAKRSLWDLIDRTKKADEIHYLNENNKYAQMIRKASLDGGLDRLYQIRRVEARTCPEDTCPTLTANMGSGGHNVPFLIDNFGIRKLTVEECLALQGYRPGEIVFPAEVVNSQKYSMIGNAIYPDVAEAIMKKIDYSQMKGSNNDKLVLSA